MCDLAGDDCNDLGFQTLNGVTTVTFTCGTYSTTACDELTAAGQLIKAAVFSPDLWVFGASYFDFSSYNYTMYHAQTTTVLGEAEDKIALWSGIAKNFGRNLVSPKFYKEELSEGGWRVAAALRISFVSPMQFEVLNFTRHHNSIRAEEKQSWVPHVHEFERADFDFASCPTFGSKHRSSPLR